MIEFIQDVFRGEIARKYVQPDGTIMHAEVRIDDSIVMIGKAGGSWEPFSNWLHVYVSDADQAYQRALQASATSVQEPKRRERDADKRGGVLDKWSNTWWTATEL